MGATYATKLAGAPGVGVSVIAQGERASRLRRDGVTVNGRRYDFRVVDPSEPSTPADLLIVAVKYPAFASALQQTQHQIGPDTVVLSLLNGTTSEDEIAAAYPQCHPLTSITFGIDTVRQGQSVNYVSFGRIEFGEKTNIAPFTPQVRWLSRLFDTAGISNQVPPDMVKQLWWKFMINVGVNQVTAIYEAPYATVQDTASPAHELMIAAQREVVAVAAAKGVDLTDADMVRWLGVLADLGPHQYTSMAQDVLAHRPTEVDIFAGAMVRFGAELGVPVPVNQYLFDTLKAKEAAW